MIVSISRDITGLSSSLYYDTSSSTFVRNCQPDASLFGDVVHTDICDSNVVANNVFALEGKRATTTPPERYAKSMQQLQTGSYKQASIPWHLTMPQAEYKKWIVDMARSTSSGLQSCECMYYHNVFKDHTRLFESLQAPYIDHKNYELAKHEMKSNETIMSFEPCHDEFAERVVYDRFSVRTGRLKVASGPRILQLPKKFRNIIGSRFRNGKVVIFDYVSFEAQVALAVSGQKTSADVYNQLAYELFDGQIARESIKIATLCVLYGGSEALIAQKLRVSVPEARQMIASLRQHFRFKSLQDSLLDDALNLHAIRNYYGRRVEVPDGKKHLVVNSYIQSTAADAAHYGYLSLIDQLDSKSVPLFLIHDALVVDCCEKDVNRLKELSAYAEHITKFDEQFHCRFDIVNHEH